jgi:acyl-CoA reductase-like NAD-dependent aldehyde dehydrogenase
VESGVKRRCVDVSVVFVSLAWCGFWFKPTVFTGVTQSHRIAQEEIFGPF